MGKLTKIIPQGGHPLNPDWPMIQVSWLYKKGDLDCTKLGIPNDDFKRFLGDNELFPCTDHTDLIFADAIEAKARVY